ncbi:lipid A deacylase LpxR family protein [Aliikangiella coralliicola]|uniref:Lipid A deacylase LpxR family protein n=1 Tax=Aliikangiella coralliicola TaxID=2592383 RepID=A0A545U7B9_9GAMM|nr:lipid A deacylase LpxR family protein [Aliikangiella coralliicola]TQV85368.1 lipid A deacylase LpxR family protein [Aliikangiella coralliicola]
MKLLPRIFATLLLLLSVEFAEAEELMVTKTTVAEEQEKNQQNERQQSGQPIIGTINAEKNPHRGWVWDSEVEPYDTGWALYIDNDLFALRSSDQDYTGGFSLTLAGRRAVEYDFSLNPILERVDQLTGFESLHSQGDRQLHSIEMGFTVFTPESIANVEEQVGDRPYASLLFLSNTHESIDFESDTAWVSTFTLGVIGSSLISEVQTELHKTLGSETPVGWNNQISDGGELTARYSIARQSLFHFNYRNEHNFEVSTTMQASVGYISEASFGLAARVGQFDTPWYSFRPQFNDYSEKSASLAGLNKNQEEFYFWGGFNLHLRAYNAFLQGQFKNNTIEYSSSEVRNIVAEAWLGVTRQFKNGWRLSYLLRTQSSEVKVGKADRSVYWGGLILSKGL